MSAAYEWEIKERPAVAYKEVEVDMADALPMYSQKEREKVAEMNRHRQDPDRDPDFEEIEEKYTENALSSAAALAALRLARIKLNNLTRDTPQLDEAIEQARKAFAAAPAGSDAKRAAEATLVAKTRRAVEVRAKLAEELENARDIWVHALVGRGDSDQASAQRFFVAFIQHGRVLQRTEVRVADEQQLPTFYFTALNQKNNLYDPPEPLPWGKTEVPSNEKGILPAGAPAPQLKVGDTEKNMVISFECEHRNIWIQMPFAPEWTHVTHEHKGVEPGKRVYSKKEVVVKTVGCEVYFHSVPTARGSVVEVIGVSWRDLYV